MSTTTDRVRVARVEDEHLSALAEFYRQVWDRNATAEAVRSARTRSGGENPVNPGEPPPTWLVFRDATAIAHVTSIPIVVSLRDQDVPAYWIKGLRVLPEFQRSAAGFLLLREAVRGLEPAPLLALVHEPAALRLFGALDFADLGPLPNDLRVLRARALLARLDVAQVGLGGIPRWMRRAVRLAQPAAPVCGTAADTALSLWAGLRTGPLRDSVTTVSDVLDRPSAEHLWRSARSHLGAAPFRDPSALASRYEGESRYRFVHVRSGNRLTGLGIVRRPRDNGDRRLRGIRVSTVSDLLFDPRDSQAGLAVLRGVERAGTALGADALLCSASAAATQPLLRRRGYVRLPGNLHILTRFTDIAAPPNLDAWWFTRGDSLGDEVF